MKFTLQTVATVLALAAAAPASANITLGSTQGGSSVFLSVWDSARNISYTRNLGTNLNGFLPSGLTTLPTDGNINGISVTGDKTPDAGLTLSFAGDALFAATFASSVAENIQWNVVAYDNQASAGSGLSRVLTTSNGVPAPTNAGIGLMGSGATNYLNVLAPLFASADSVVITDPSSFGYAGSDNFGDSLNGGLQGSSSAVGFGSTLDFYYLARTVVSGSNSAAATNIQYANAGGPATWTLAADGTAIYAVSAVPEPSAAWLLLAGLGVVGVKAARRRRADDENAVIPA